MARYARPRDAVNDFVKVLRANYERPDVSSYEPSFTKGRTEFSLETKKDEGYKKLLHNNRQQNLDRGFFTPGFLSYKSVGHVCADSKRLVLEQLADSLPQQFLDKYHYERPTTTTTEIPQPKPSRDVTISPNQDTEVTSADTCEWERRRIASQSAGMQEIKGLLQEANQRVTAVKAGQDYVKLLKISQEKRKKAKGDTKDEEGEMKMKRLSSHFLMSVNTVPMVQAPIPMSKQTMLAKETVDLLAPLKGTKRKLTLRLGKGNAIVLNLQDLANKMKRKPNRKTLAFIKKLKHLFTLLCCLHNIKGKYLRSKAFLTPDVMKTLKKDPFANKEGRTSQMKSVMPSSDAILPRADHSFMVNKSSIAHHRPSISLDRSTLPSNLSHLHSKTEHGKRRIRMQLSAKSSRTEPTVLRVETWEDLINIGSKSKKVRKNPPWYIQNYHQPEKSIHIISQAAEQGAEHMETYHADSVVSRLQSEMILLKEEIARRSALEVDKRERGKLGSFRYKLSMLDDLHPLWERQKCVLDEIDKCSQEVDGENEFPTWFTNLLEEADNLNDPGIPDVSDDFTLLENFTKIDLHELPAVKEKLCLITLSLPVYDVCNPAMQSAIKFILVEILHLREELLEQWLNYRNLYVI